jgi:ketosteroid isomerase-like protein
MGGQEVGAVRAQYERFTQTKEVLPEIYTEDVAWMAAREDPDAATHVGPDAIQAYFTQWVEMFTDIEYEVKELVDAGDKVFAWIRFEGRGISSGIAAVLEQAQVWMFRDGKVVRVEEYHDRDEGLRAAGLPAEGGLTRSG